MILSCHLSSVNRQIFVEVRTYKILKSELLRIVTAFKGVRLDLNVREKESLFSDSRVVCSS